MKNIALVVVLALGFLSRGTAQLNPYQYVVVPKKFQEFDQENKYHTSTLVKYLLGEAGFTAYYDGEVPAVIIDKCKGLRIELLDESTTFRTKVFLAMKDCNGSEVFRTAEVDSRIKSFKESYEEAIRKAFKSIEALNYTYEPVQNEDAVVTLPFDKDVKALPEPKEKEVVQRPSNPAVIQQATPGEQRYIDKRPQPSEVQKITPAPVAGDVPATKGKDASEVWYAQILPNGYQLVDRTPKIRLNLYSSSLPNVYLAENETQHGLVYQQDNRWFFEFYKAGERVVQELNIKF